MRTPKRIRGILADRGDFLVRYRRSLPWVVLLAALALVGIFGGLLIRYLDRQERQVMQLQAVELASGLEQRMRGMEALLRATGTAFAFVPDIDRDFFSSYYKGLQLNRRYSGMVGLGWAVAVPRENIPAIEARLRAEGDPDFFIWPVADTRTNYAILYLEPNTRENRAAIGFNMYSDPARRAAMLEAFKTGIPKATGPVILKQDGDSPRRTGFLLYAPVFDATRRQGSEAPTKTSFRGFVYAAFRVDELARSALGARADDALDLELYDVTGGGEPALLYDMRPEIWSAPEKGSAVTYLSVAGRSWKLAMAPVHPGRFSQIGQRVLVYALLATGVLLSILAALMVWLMVRSVASSQSALAKQTEQVEIRTVLLRELNHRVKNTLATVNSLAALSRQGATDVASYYEALNGRLRALSATHDLLTSSDWGDTELRDIVEAELAPFRGVKGQVTIEGPPVSFDPTKALAIGLSLHELATNASKYGALSAPGGRVSVTWRMDDENRLHLRWVEEGGPSVPTERKGGFGSTLIEKLMARQLRAEVRLAFPPEGATCSFVIPMPSGGTGKPIWRQDGGTTGQG